MTLTKNGRRRGRPPRDDDIPPRIGRSRDPEIYGPPEPESHERQEYVDGLQRIFDAVEIDAIGRGERLYLQFLLHRCDRLRGIDAKRFPEDGDGHVTLLLRSIVESANGPEALVLPVIRAVNGCSRKAWADRGLEWFEALDEVPILETLKVLRILGLEDQLERVLRVKLEAMLGPPVGAGPKKKPPTKTMMKPSWGSEQSWNEVMAMHKAAKRRAQLRRKARMAA